MKQSMFIFVCLSLLILCGCAQILGGLDAVADFLGGSAPTTNPDGTTDPGQPGAIPAISGLAGQYGPLVGLALSLLVNAWQTARGRRWKTALGVVVNGVEQLAASEREKAKDAIQTRSGGRGSKADNRLKKLVASVKEG